MSIKKSSDIEGVVYVQKYEWRQFEKGSLLENGVALNMSATEIWKACDGRTSIGKIIEKFVDDYGITLEMATKDIRNCIEELVNTDSIEKV